MKITRDRLKQMIKEEMTQVQATRIEGENLQEAEFDIAKVQDGAIKVANELMKDGGPIDAVIEKAAMEIVKDFPENLQTAMTLIKQEMARAQG